MDVTHSAAFAASAPGLGRRGVLGRGRCTVTRRNVKVAGRTPPRMTKASSSGGAGGYWRGEWICVDCGYVYKPGRKVKFEDLPGTWKCPQCNAPKRRFAKKAGDVIQETAGTSNVPIVIFSVVGLVAVVLFGVWASTQL